MEKMIDELINVVENEKRHEVEKVHEKIPATVLKIEGNTVRLNFKNHLYLGPGDVIGYETTKWRDILGSIVDVNYKTNSLVVSLYSYPNLYSYPRFERGDVISIFESESVIGYNLQLQFLEKVRTGNLSRQEKIIADHIFKSMKIEKIRRKERLDDKNGLEGFLLDKSQIKAIKSILSLGNGEILLIIGPPGTGKTQVIAKAAYELYEKGEKVLISSHTNRAVDNVIGNLPLDKALRIGRPEKIHPKIKKYTLSYKAKEIERIKATHGTKEGHEELNELQIEKGKMIEGISEELVNETPLIGSTLIKSQLYPLKYVKFDTVFIDECSQASIPLALLGMLKGKKCILVGDHKQLLPIFKSIKEKTLTEKYSAFNHLLNKYPKRSMWLKYHYRSNVEIIGFCKRRFYENKIRPAKQCRDLKLKINGWKSLDRGEILDPDKPVVFVHVEGKESYKGASRYNEDEAKVCSKIVKNLLDCGLSPDKIGIITPYRPQKGLITKKIGANLEINTVDAFQGRQKDVIIFSIASTKSMEFASDPNRINVAFTRPIYKLIVVGNVVFSQGEIENFVEYALKRKSVYWWEKRRWLRKEIKNLNKVRKYIINQAMKGKYSKDKIGVSDLGYCIRKSQFKRKHPKKPDFERAFKMFLGSLFHEIVEKRYDETEKGVCRVIFVDGKRVEIRGKIDAVVGNGIIDFKSTDTRRLPKIIKDGPNEWDKNQVKFYAGAGNYQRAFLQYYLIDPTISLNDMTNTKRFESKLREKISHEIRIKPIIFPIDLKDADNVVKEYEILAAKLYKSLVENEPPEFEPCMKWMCNKCEYRETCKKF